MMPRPHCKTSPEKEEASVSAGTDAGALARSLASTVRAVGPRLSLRTGCDGTRKRGLTSAIARHGAGLSNFATEYS